MTQGWTEVTILDGFIYKTTIDEVLDKIDRFNHVRLIDVNTGPLMAARTIRDEGSGKNCRYAVVGDIRDLKQHTTDRKRKFGFIEFRDSPGRQKSGIWLVRCLANYPWATTYFEALGEYLRMVCPELGGTSIETEVWESDGEGESEAGQTIAANTDVAARTAEQVEEQDLGLDDAEALPDIHPHTGEELTAEQKRLAHRLPKKTGTFGRYAEMCGVICEMHGDYKDEFAGWTTGNPNPTNEDIRDKLRASGYKAADRTIQRIERFGHAGLLDTD